MLRAERTWRGRYLRVTRVTPLTFYPEWMVQVAHQGGGGASGSRWPWPCLCQELRTQELAGVLWPTWRRFDPSSSPAASSLFSSVSDCSYRRQKQRVARQRLLRLVPRCYP